MVEIFLQSVNTHKGQASYIKQKKSIICETGVTISIPKITTTLAIIKLFDYVTQEI